MISETTKNMIYIYKKYSTNVFSQTNMELCGYYLYY